MSRAPDFLDVQAALGDEETARALHSASPSLLISPGLEVRWCNDAALAYFAVTTSEALTARVIEGSDPGCKRLRQLIRLLEPGARRTERLRFRRADDFEPARWTVRRLASPADLLMVALEAPSVFAVAQAGAEVGSDPVGRFVRTGDGKLADLRSRWNDSVPHSGMVRFLWRADGAGRVEEVDDVFARAVGGGSLVGRTIFETAEGLGADPEQALRRAFASDETWTKVCLHWPISGSTVHVLTTFGATPLRKKAGRVEAWSGFGVLDFARAIETAPTEEKRSLPARDAVAEIEPTALNPAAEDREARDHEQRDHVEAAPDSGFGPNVVALRRLQLVRTESDRTDNASVAPAAGQPESPSESGTEGIAHGLTLVERSAFQEIALALGARLPGLSRDIKRRESETSASAEPVGDRAAEPIAMPPASDQSIQPPTVAMSSHVLAEALRRAPVPIVVCRDDHALWANAAFLTLSGWDTIEQLEAKSNIARVLRGMAGSSSPRVSFQTRRGETLLLDGVSATVDWPQGQVAMTAFNPADASEKARADTLEMELRQRDGEARELHAILDTATDGVVVLDDEGRVISLNRAGEALFGVDQSEVAGESLTALLAVESHAAALDYFGQVSSNSVASLMNDGREIVGRARRGGSIPMFMTLGRVNAGGTVKFCAVLRDLTAWKKAENELDEARREAERASALKSDFLAKVSHEIRTPLNAILGFAEVIMDERFGPVGNERYRDYLKDIHASGTHVMSLVNDLLDLSKIEAGKMELQFGSVDVNKVVSECVSIMQPQANGERVIVRLSTAPNMPRVLADERSLRQIVLNLLSNAVKFNEPGGQVIVSTAFTDAGHSVIRIRDTGIGMSDADLVTALEPFRQVQTSHKVSGTGLGLPLTKALVEANHASFMIKSKKSEGTLVEVTFPRARVMAE